MYGSQAFSDGALLTLVRNAVLPWNSVDSAELPEPETYDTQADIDACCFCHRSECVNCLGGGKSTRRGGSEKKFDKDKFLELIRSNKNLKEVCAESGMSRTTYFRYKKLYAKGELG